MASSPGQPPSLHEGSEPLTNISSSNGNPVLAAFEGPLSFDDDNDDEQILVEHDHSQLISRKYSAEAKRENVINNS